MAPFANRTTAAAGLRTRFLRPLPTLRVGRPRPRGPDDRRRGGVLAVVVVLLLVFAAVGLLWWRSQRPATPPTGGKLEKPPASGPEDAGAAAKRATRERVAALFSRHAVEDQPGALEEAEAALAPLLAEKEPDSDDLIAAAILARARDRGGDRESDVRHNLAKVLERDGGDPRAHYLLARLDLLEGNLPSAEVHLAKALERAPGDLPTQLLLAQTLEERDPAAAEKLYRAVIERGVDNAGSWYVTAVFRLSILMRDLSREADFRRYQAEYQTLADRGLSAPKEVDFDRGNLANLKAPQPAATDAPLALRAPKLASQETVLPELAGFEHLAARDLDGDGRQDLVAWGSRGVAVGLRAADGGYLARMLDAEAVHWLATADFGSSSGAHSKEASALDLLCARGGTIDRWRVSLDAARPATWSRAETPLIVLPSPPLDGLSFDYDHEGDLDVVLVGRFGMRLLRNDGAGAPAAGASGFTEVTQEAGLQLGRVLSWVVAEDFDTDQDVDLLCGEARDVLLLTNLRGGRFAPAPDERLVRFAATPIRPLVADIDLDGRPDLWGAGPFSLVYFNGPAGALRPDPSRKLARGEDSRLAPDGGEVWPGATPAELLGGDFDGDGVLDAAWKNLDSPVEDVLSVQLGVGRHGQAGCDVVLAREKSAGWPALSDLDGDGANEILLSTSAGVSVTRLDAKPASSLRLDLRGVKDNRRGVGAVVETRIAGAYRREYWRGEPQALGLPAAQAPEWLRVTWPNGVIQYDIEAGRDPAAPLVLEQVEGLIGSCPFLYTWNGSEYVFISDVLGITPLGLPMAPGMLVPPDHDEYVLVRGEHLAPKNGRFELQVTEELREVTYLDRVRLDVIDHPEGTEVFPNERFTFPPFPLAHVHTLHEPLAPVRASASDGGDWTAALSAIDDRYAVPCAPAPAQMLGLCAPHYVEVEFDLERVRDPALLRLFLTGWFFWTDASVNMAAARDPAHEFVPPVIQVPDGKGGWRDAGPPIGFPAGKTKTMVVDVSKLLVREDPRLRITTTLRLYWDAIRLGVDGDDAPLTVTSIEPASAELWRRGFSAPVLDARPEQPARFQWNRLEPRPRWNPHPGAYTRYGPVLPLVGAIDDQFVILGSGDALRIAFDASKAPALPAGWRRDFLVYLDGWAKDRDPNTVEALHVEPLPFHGMSGYPYGADEHYPVTAPVRKYLREYVTRPAENWLPRGP